MPVSIKDLKSTIMFHRLCKITKVKYLNIEENDLLFFKEPKQGYLISKKHIYYEGDFINGLPNGKGFAIYPSGDYF